MRYLSEDFDLRLWTDLVPHGQGLSNRQKEIYKNALQNHGGGTRCAGGREIGGRVMVLSPTTIDDHSSHRDDDYYDPCAGSPDA